LISKDGKLMVERRPGVANELVPIGENRFLMTGMPIKFEISFKETWPGFRLMLVSTGEGTPLALVYAGPDSPVPAQLAEYAGTFQSDEADATVTLVAKDGKLVLCTAKYEEPPPPGDSGPSRGWYPLEAICADAFKNPWIGLLRFTRDSGKHITGFVVSNFAGGVRHLQFQKGHPQFVREKL